MLLPDTQGGFAHLTWNGEMWSGKEPDGSSVEVRGIRFGKFLRLDFPGLHGEKKTEIFFLAQSNKSLSKGDLKPIEIIAPIKNQAFKGILKNGPPDGGALEGASISVKFNELGQLILPAATAEMGPLIWNMDKKLWEAAVPNEGILQIKGTKYGQLLQLEIVATQNKKLLMTAWYFLSPDSDYQSH